MTYKKVYANFFRCLFKAENSTKACNKQWKYERKCRLIKRHTSTSTNHTLSSLLENPLVHKYLKFIQDTDTHKNNENEILTQLIGRRKQLEEDLKNLEMMSRESDKDFEKLIEDERKTFMKNLNEINIEILKNSLPNAIDDKSEQHGEGDTEVQIYPAIGGDEAKLFAEELFAMYLNFAAYKNWHCLLAEMRTTGKGDFRNGGYLLLSGESPYQDLINEAGVHRVQRVPATEKTGRTHTSTCTVVILKKESCNEINIKSKDLEYELMRSSGPGGQNVNKVETCVRLKHIPTGITVECQESRYQFDNKKFALQKLKNILLDLEQKKITSNRKASKKEQAGTNDYSDKIRTYHYTQNRVTDHRINYTMHNLQGFLSGGKDLSLLIEKVMDHKKREIILDHIEKTLSSTEYKNFVMSGAKT